MVGCLETGDAIFALGSKLEPLLVLDGSLLPINSSIKNFKQEKTGYVANVVEQTLQLPDDMTDLRTMKKYKVFLSLKRDLTMVSFSS